MTKELGKLRPSQLISYYAPGSIVDLIEDSVMIVSADQWDIPYENVIYEERLQRYLKINHLKLIGGVSDKLKVKGIPFPQWRICPSCGMMSPFVRRTCYYCEKERKVEIKLYPARFIVVCDKGHISDFPWIEWVHKGIPCEKPILKYESRGETGSLSDITVRCVKCNRQTNLGKIMQQNELKQVLPKCTGERPWLGDREFCKEGQVKTSLRSASDVFTPIVASAISIPLLDERDELFFQVEQSRQLIDNIVQRGDNEENIKNMVCIMFNIEEALYEKVMRIYHNEEEALNYDRIRRQEWATFKNKEVDDRHNTGFLSKEIKLPISMKGSFSTLLRIDKLREVRVLQGFTRLYYPDPFSEETPEMLPIMKKKKEWLPAIEVIGEGVFFEFRRESIVKWESNKRVKEEAHKIIQRYNKQREIYGYEKRLLLPRHILIHTFAHMMIKEFAIHSGYATTSLRERLYCGDNMMGVLIYTSSSDSEGSLGGLIELTKEEKLIHIFEKALNKMEYCSSDPLCVDGDIQFHTSINGAACHACCFISETSCEWNNQLLDRRMINPLPGEEDLAYF
ncbi:hypothetical protein CACET_c12510 [Clostridium aceticum]|uniref:Uncharacterized protein n=1 Tax=Clostridium aceticum TaxID=84022 RepID=A0A0D8IBK5_9CLOT|nr:DUF1998 domain-containing protein [Clostridium aceticum]AKL94716.1 hypothetical protein CACET_c12510 [Clostridium aceticum]KJF27675.1 hypothetical protein TZ02_03390 [Clostridium aceticum]